MQPLSGAPAQLTTALWKAAARPHCVFYHCIQSFHEGKKKAKGEEVKRKMKNRGKWCLGSWLLSIKGPPSLLLWREKGGWRVGVHSSLFIARRGVDFGCELGMKTGLSPRRNAGLGRLMLPWPNSKQYRDPSPQNWLTRRSLWFVSPVIYGCTVQN